MSTTALGFISCPCHLLRGWKAQESWNRLEPMSPKCDPLTASAAKRTLDVAGHYGRPDIFKLEVNREVLAPIDFG